MAPGKTSSAERLGEKLRTSRTAVQVMKIRPRVVLKKLVDLRMRSGEMDTRGIMERDPVLEISLSGKGASGWIN